MSAVSRKQTDAFLSAIVAERNAAIIRSEKSENLADALGFFHAGSRHLRR
jgi:hypothetical protein